MTRCCRVHMIDYSPKSAWRTAVSGRWPNILLHFSPIYAARRYLSATVRNLLTIRQSVYSETNVLPSYISEEVLWPGTLRSIEW